MKQKQYSWLRDFVVYNITTVIATTKQGNLRILRDLRYFGTWRKFRRSENGTIEHEVPWLVFSSIDYLDDYLTRNMTVFEFGSGGSTEYLRKRVKQIFSVEHDAEWFQKVSQHFKRMKVENVDLQLALPEEDEAFFTKKSSNPHDFISERSEYVGKSFSQYVKSIERFDDDSFDMIIVDGRARSSCIMISIPKLKKGGILLVDNSDRTAYLRPFPEFGDTTKWLALKFTGHFPFAPASITNETSVFKKLY